MSETCKDCGKETSDPVQDGGWPPGFRCPECHEQHMKPIYERHRQMEREGGSLLDFIRVHEG